MLLFNKFELIGAFTSVVDMVNTNLANHHQRTAYLADQLCRKLDMPQDDRQQVVLTSLMHDIGVVPLRAKVDDLLFERDMNLHSWAGWMMLRSCPVFEGEAALIRYHHYRWAEVRRVGREAFHSAKLGNLICLADHLDIISRGDKSPREAAADMKTDQASYAPAYLEAALDMLDDPELFADLGEKSKRMDIPDSKHLFIDLQDMLIFADIFATLIDSRSPFTASHSRSVAHLALYLHQLAGLPREDAHNIFMAGLLHDIGKMAIDLDLIEKQGQLSSEEYDQVSKHAVIGWETLSKLPGFQKVAVWGGLHHERLNGSGYPFGLGAADIPVESRIMAVADVLTALMEDRPYRAGFQPGAAAEIISNMAKSKALDADLVSMACQNIVACKEIRTKAQFSMNFTPNLWPQQVQKRRPTESPRPVMVDYAFEPHPMALAG